MTGEPLGVGMNGYAVMEQTTTGLAQRQYARTIILGQPDGNRVVLTVADLGLMFQSIHLEVLRRLRAEFGDRYHQANVLLSASHTHAGPGGTSGHAMVNLTTFGFRPVTFEATIAGIVESIRRADRDFQPTTFSVSHSDVPGLVRNRSIEAFRRNPPAEQQRFPHGANNSSLSLHLHRNGTHVGVMNWFAIHPTQLPPSNTRIHGDNKGAAAWVTEHNNGVDHTDLGHAPFVAAYAQSAPGDISGNTALQPGTGLGNNPEENTWIVGNRLAEDVRASATAGKTVSGAVSWRYAWRDMAAQRVPGRWTADGKPGTTGPAILGAAFAVSSQEDGGGVEWLPLNEGERGGNPLVAQLTGVMVPPEVKAYQHPKQGYTSGYGHYVTTPEEYEQQDYEGGATPFGRHQLPATQMIFHELATALAQDKPVNSGQPAGDLTGKIPAAPAGGPRVDAPLPGRRYGDSLKRIAGVRRGEPVVAEFCAANPNNNIRHGDTYVRIERKEGSGWTTVATDNYWSVRVAFRVQALAVTSRVTWSTHAGNAPGRYRIRYFGDWRDLGGKTHPFVGVTNEFDVR